MLTDKEVHDKDYIEAYRFKNLNGNTDVAAKEIEESLKKLSLYANEHLKSISKKERVELELYVTDYLSKLYINEYLSGLKIDEEEKVLKSYYEMYKKEKYTHPKILNVYTLKFDTNEEAKKYKKENSGNKELLKNKTALGYRLSSYEDLPYDKMNSIFKNHVDYLKEYQLSDPIEYDSGVFLLFYSDLRPGGVYAFENVKDQIKEYLISKKRDENLEKLFRKLKGEQ